MYSNSVPIEEELRKNPGLKKSDIEKLKKWCAEKKPYTPSTWDSDLAIFLHSSYYCLETAKSNIENYYTARKCLPQFFENHPTYSGELKKIFDTVAVITLEKRTRKGYKVILIRPLDVGTIPINFTETIKVLNMVLDINIHEEGTQKGYIFVVDVHGSNVFERNSDVPSVRKYFEYLQNGVPIRWFGLHFINTLLPFQQSNPFTRLTIFEDHDINAVYYVHSNLDSLSDFVPLDVLPDEMGGRAGPLKVLQAAQVEKLCNYIPYSCGSR